MTETYTNSYADKTILLTGGAGAIGSNLCRALLRAEAGKVVLLDDLSSAAKWSIPTDRRVLFVEGSVTDDAALRRVFSERPEIVFHFAALFANQNSLDHPEDDLIVNGLGTLKTLEFAHLSGISRFIFASSGCSVYGKSPLPLREDFQSMDLDTPYQITKMLGELYANFFFNYYKLPTVRTRFFNSFGPGEIPGRYRNVIPNFIYWAMKGEPLPITGSGEQTRDWTYVEDIVDGLLRAGFMPEAIGQAFNLASGHETTVLQMATWVNEEVGNTAGMRFMERKRWDTKDRLLASVELAGKLVGYKPTTDFREGLRRTVQWFRDNWSQIEVSARF